MSWTAEELQKILKDRPWVTTDAGSAINTDFAQLDQLGKEKKSSYGRKEDLARHFEQKCYESPIIPSSFVKEKSFKKLGFVDINGKPRKHRFDFYWHDYKVAAEIDGGIYKQTKTGRSAGHCSPVQYEKDREKDAISLTNGVVVFRFTAKQVYNGKAIKYLEKWFGQQGEVDEWEL